MPFLIPVAIAVGSAVATAAFVASDILIPLALGAIGVSGASLAAASAFAFAATTTVIETAALAGISAVLSPHPAVNTAGSPQQFKPDPNAPPPVVMGRYGVGGNLVYETTSGGGNATAAGAKGNEYLTSFIILSALGPVQAFETLRFNDTILTFDPNGQACNGGYIPYDEVQEWNPGYRHQNSDGSYINNNYQDRAWQNLQLGALNAGYFAPPDKLASDNAGLPEWTQAHGFSSFCAAALTLVYDQRYYAGGVPQYQWVLQGIKIYDPRQDGTYPGGSGPQRWAGVGATAAQIEAARATWTFNQNPAIHALNFALGYFLPDSQTGPGRLYAGIGAGTAGVDIAAFVAAANVADANDWLICGQWTTGDGKWSVLTEMLKAGSATPVIDCGIISCIVDQPLTSLGTVTADDLSGPITLPTGSSFTARLNTIFPRFTSEAHRWQMVTADTPVKAATYVTEDGAVRSKTLDWQYVPAVNQACQLAAYAITNGREIPGITLPGKPKLRNYKVGDCFTLDIDEAGLATTKVMVTMRVTEQSTGGVTLTVRTETDAKHAYSLGVSGVAPATPGISGFDPTIVEAPLPDFWATGALEVSDADTGESRVVIRVTGSADDAGGYAQTVVLRWRPVALVAGAYTPTGNASWSYRSFPASQGQFDLDLNPGVYDVQIAYITVNGAYPDADQDFLDLGVETVGGSIASNTANVGDLTADQVVNQLQSSLDAINAAQASLSTLSDEIAAAQEANADVSAAVDQVSADLTAAQTQLQAGIDAAQADAETVALTGLTAASAQFDQNQSLKAQTYMPDGTAVNFALTRNISFQAGVNSATAEQLTGIGVTIDDDAASISDLQQTTVDLAAQKADASDLEALQTSYDAFSSSVSQFEDSTSGALSAQAETDTQLQAATAGVQANLNDEATVRATADEALTATDETQAGEIGDATASIADLSDTVTASGEAQTQTNEELTSQVGDLQATTSEQAGTLADVTGRLLLAYLQFTAAAGGNMASVRIAADQTSSAIQLIAQVIALANDVNGVPINVLTVANGVVSIAGKLLLGSSMQLDPATGTFYGSLGASALALGGPFGASGDLAFWCGPSMALSGMSKSNGKFWFDTAGDAYFGGSLSAGTLTTKAGTSDTSTAAVAETAVFGSNGGAITVTLSYSFVSQAGASYASLNAFNQARASDPDNPQAVAGQSGDYAAGGQDPGPCTLALYRSVNGGAYAQVATLSVQGSWTDTYDNAGDSWSSQQQDSVGGSLTYTDPQQVADNRQYKAVLTGRSTHYSANPQQNISLICVEQ